MATFIERTLTNNLGESHRFSLEKPFQCLDIKLEYGGNFVKDLDTDIGDMYNDITVNVSLRTRKGGETILYPNVPLAAITMFAQYQEGALPIRMTEAGVHTIWARIPIAMNGSFPMSNDDTVYVTLNGLPVGPDETPANSNYLTVYTKESPTFDHRVLVWNTQTLKQGDKQKQFSLEDTRYFLIQDKASIDFLLMRHSNGVTENKAYEQLVMDAFAENDLIFSSIHIQSSPAYHGIGGTAEFFVIPSSGILSVDMYTNGNFAIDCYMISTEALAAPSDVEDKNESLVDTVDPIDESQDEILEAKKSSN